MANSKLMKRIWKEILRPQSGMFMARYEGPDLVFIHRINRRFLKAKPVVCVNPENVLDWDVFIDIRIFITDEDCTVFNNEFTFGQGYVSSMSEEHNLYVKTFRAWAQLQAGKTVYWLKTTPVSVHNDHFTEMDLEIFHRMMQTTETQTAEEDFFEAKTAYPMEELYPFGWLSARLTFPQEFPHDGQPRVQFTSPILHPNIFQDGTVNPDIYAGDWRSVQGVNNILDLIFRILKEPVDEHLANEDAAKMWENNHRQYTDDASSFISLTQQMSKTLIDIINTII